MHILLTDIAGEISEGVVLAAGPNIMRVALQGRSDTMELCLSYGVWTSDHDQKFEIGALTDDTDVGMSCLGSILRTKVLTAGMQIAE